MAEVAKALQERKAAKAKFTQKKNAFFTAVAKKENMDDIEGNFNELTKAWRDVEGKHDTPVITSYYWKAMKLQKKKKPG